MSKILVTGALGQIGSELVPALRARYGDQQVIASDIRTTTGDRGRSALRRDYEYLDCTRYDHLLDIVRRHDVDTIYHLAALLSAVAEEKPQAAWQLNMGGLYHVLEAARRNACAVFFPSSIGAFGPETPKDQTPQVTIQRPTSIYGVAKVAGELLADYYHSRFGVDCRGLRLPGLISSETLPGGGTTDYAVDIFYQAVRYRHYTCFLRPDTRLDMMYMPDAIRAMIELMQADSVRLHHHNAYNVAAISLTPEELAGAIRKHIPEFVIDYEVDPMRQAIADSWPRSVDDRAARCDWRWQAQYDLETMTADMLSRVRRKINKVSPHAP